METNCFVVRLLLALALMVFAPSCSPDSDDDDQADDDDAVTDDDADDDAVIDDDADDDAIIDDDADDDGADDDSISAYDLIDGGGFYQTAVALPSDRGDAGHVLTISAGFLMLYRIHETSVTKEVLVPGVSSFLHAVDANGALHVVYRSMIESAHHYLTDRSGQWVDEPLSVPANGWVGDLAVDAEGMPHLCLKGDNGLIYRRRADGGDWTDETVTADSPWQCALAIGDEGYAHILASYEGDNNPVFATYFTNWSGDWVSRPIASYYYTPVLGWGGFSALDVAVDQEGMPQFAYQAYIGVMEDASYMVGHARFENGAVVRWIDNGDSMIDRMVLLLDENGTAAFFASGHVLHEWTNRSGLWVHHELEQVVSSGVSAFGDLSLGVLIGYIDEVSSTLRLGLANDDGWISEELDHRSIVLGSVALAIDEAGVMYVAYADFSTQSVMLANNTAGEWQTERMGPLPDGDEEGLEIRLALDPAGEPRLLYQCVHQFPEVLATRGEKGWLLTTPVNGNAVTGFAVDDQGFNHLAYWDYPDEEVYYATDRSGEWQSELVAAAPEGVSPSLALDSAGAVHLAYGAVIDWALLFYYATDASGDWVVEQPFAMDVGRIYPIALDRDDRPHAVVMRQEDDGDGSWNRLRHIWKSGGQWSNEVIYQAEFDNDAIIGNGNLALDNDGGVYVSFCVRCWQNPEIWYAANRTGAWTSGPLFPYDGRAEEYPDSDIAIGAAGQAHTAFDLGGALWHAPLPPEE